MKPRCYPPASKLALYMVGEFCCAFTNTHRRPVITTVYNLPNDLKYSCSCCDGSTQRLAQIDRSQTPVSFVTSNPFLTPKYLAVHVFV